MWRMLWDAKSAKGMDTWKLTYSGIQADTSSGKAHWDAGAGHAKVDAGLDTVFRQKVRATTAANLKKYLASRKA